MYTFFGPLCITVSKSQPPYVPYATENGSSDRSPASYDVRLQELYNEARWLESLVWYDIAKGGVVL